MLSTIQASYDLSEAEARRTLEAQTSLPQHLCDHALAAVARNEPTYSPILRGADPRMGGVANYRFARCLAAAGCQRGFTILDDAEDIALQVLGPDLPWPTPPHSTDYRERLAAVALAGGVIVRTVAGPPDVGDVHATVGLKEFGFPELAITTLSRGAALGVIRTLTTVLATAGEPLEPATLIPGLAPPAACALLPLDEALSATIFQAARTVYGSDPDGRQVVFADGSGRLPWDPACEPAYGAGYPLLGPAPASETKGSNHDQHQRT